MSRGQFSTIYHSIDLPQVPISMPHVNTNLLNELLLLNEVIEILFWLRESMIPCNHPTTEQARHSNPNFLSSNQFGVMNILGDNRTLVLIVWSVLLASLIAWGGVVGRR